MTDRTCAGCRAYKPRESFSGFNPRCKVCHAGDMRERYQANKTTLKPRLLAQNRASRAKLRAETIAAYGGECACCSESEPAFLCIDHVRNDGAVDRRRRLSTHLTGTTLYAELRRAGFPRDRYQLLCANCNAGKALNGGVCPHESRQYWKQVKG